jgi:O-antigen/teichoic acid export membrane protein
LSCSPTTPDVAAPAVLGGGWLARGLRRLTASPLLQSSGLSVFDQAIVSGASFATSVILGRSAAQEELGVYYLALSVVFFARGIQEQIVSVPYMIYCGRKQGAALQEYAGSTLLHQCAIMLLVAGLLAMMVLTGLTPHGAAAAFWLLTLAAPVLLMREFIRQFLFSHLDLKAALILDGAAAAIQLVSLLLLSVNGRLTVTGTFAVLAIASGGPAIVWLAVQPRPMVGKLRAAVRDFVQNWVFARWALASQLLASTTPYVMPWILVFTHGEAKMGLLGVCSTLVGLSNTFLMGLCNFLSPRAARAYVEGGLPELRSVLWQTALLFAGTLGSLAVLVSIFGEQIATAIYGPQFAGTRAIIVVLSLSVLANSVGITAGTGLFAMERPRANFAADLVSLAVAVVTTCVFVPWLGPLGAAIATLTGTASDAAVRVWILRRTMAELAEVAS